MGFFDSAQDVLDKGVSAAKGAVSGVAVEQHAFARGFARLCSDGCAQGWNEGSGGSLSYRLTESEVSSCRSFFYDNPSSWVRLEAGEPSMAGAYLLVTAKGAQLRNVQGELSENAGLVELDQAGAAWRIVWGLKDGALPTSRLSAHVCAHAARGQAQRVVYCAHPSHIVALTSLVQPEARALTRALWKALPKGAAAFPQGVGVVPVSCAGGEGLARAVGEALAESSACVWAQRGLVVAGADFDAAFGLAQNVEKAAEVCLLARAANAGAEAPCQATDEDLRAVAAAAGVSLNEAFLG